MLALRYSPSGPVIGVAGPGMRLRLDEGRLGVEGGEQILSTTPSAVGFVFGTAPAFTRGFTTFAAGGEVVKNLYRATIVMDVQNTSNAGNTVKLDLQVDWGSTLFPGFTTVASSVHQVDAATSRQIRCDAGSTEFGTPPTDATKVVVQAVISTPLALPLMKALSVTGTPTIDLQVEELLAT